MGSAVAAPQRTPGARVEPSWELAFPGGAATQLIPEAQAVTLFLSAATGNRRP